MICEIIKKYGNNESTLDLLCEELKHHVPEEEFELLAKEIYESAQGPHFDEDFAKCQVSKMYYEEDGVKHFGPYWNDITPLYVMAKKKLAYPYNKWDFMVTLNMIKSDNYVLLREWFPEADEKEIQNKIVELAVNWLNDEDNPYGDSKVWGYFKK